MPPANAAGIRPMKKAAAFIAVKLQKYGRQPYAPRFLMIWRMV